jgi:hypothetical protein
MEAEEARKAAKRLKLDPVLNKLTQEFKIDEIPALNLAQLLMEADKYTDKFIADRVQGLIPQEEVGMILEIFGNAVRLSPEQWQTVKRIVGEEKGICSSFGYLHLILYFFSFGSLGQFLP